MEYSNLFVVMMGLGVVFFGLICIIVLTTIMGKLMYRPQKQSTPASSVQPASPAPAVQPGAAPEAINPEILAVITAVLSNERNLGSSGVHITNIIKK